LFDAGNTYIDPYRMIRHLRSGEVVTIEQGKERVHVRGLGGIAWGSRGLKSDCRKYFTDEECLCLLDMKPGSVDILLFHDTPEGYGLANVPNSGAAGVTLIIEHLQPRFAFYGHYGNPPEPLYINRTLCVGMNNSRALRLPRRKGAMGIVDTRTWTFEFVRG
jgi:Icc-related predicted phosphoesterase